MSAVGSGLRKIVALDPSDVDLAVTRTRDSPRGKLIMCDESRLVRLGRAGLDFSIEYSAPPARFARRRRRLDGRVSSNSKSVGRNAAGALWKSTTAGAGRRSEAGAATLCALLP